MTILGHFVLPCKLHIYLKPSSISFRKANLICGRETTTDCRLLHICWVLLAHCQTTASCTLLLKYDQNTYLFRYLKQNRGKRTTVFILKTYGCKCSYFTPHVVFYILCWSDALSLWSNVPARQTREDRNTGYIRGFYGIFYGFLFGHILCIVL